MRLENIEKGILKVFLFSY